MNMKLMIGLGSLLTLGAFVKPVVAEQSSALQQLGIAAQADIKSLVQEIGKLEQQRVVQKPVPNEPFVVTKWYSWDENNGGTFPQDAKIEAQAEANQRCGLKAERISEFVVRGEGNCNRWFCRGEVSAAFQCSAAQEIGKLKQQRVVQKVAPDAPFVVTKSYGSFGGKGTSPEGAKLEAQAEANQRCGLKAERISEFVVNGRCWGWENSICKGEVSATFKCSAR